MKDIKELNLKEFENVLEEWGSPLFHARQIFRWIYKNKAESFDIMTDLPESLRIKLKENFSLENLILIKTNKSKDATEKLLLKLNDGNLIESVIIPAKGRVTGCVSTQVGCKFACGFCASGLAGLKRNLSVAEILSEVFYLNKHSKTGKLTHIVFMGSGEPFDNYDNVLKAIRVINSPYAFNIGARRITISTCGIIPGINKLADEDLQVELSISLHAPTDAIRSALIPVNRKYSLKELIGSCGDYIKKTNRQITFEYILLEGINSSLQNAQDLCKILSGLKLCKVNLIPANTVKELGIQPPQKLEILLFRDYLLKHGLNVTLRKPRGEDIEAACGQLRLGHEKK